MERANGKRAAEGTAGPRPGLPVRTGRLVLKVLAFFVILEPIWMLLPFAGFLYGTGLHIQTLSRHPETAWLTHFVFPVLTLGPAGPLLVVLGFLLFLAGAVQVYSAKLGRRGLVTKGLYAVVRHPQYTALTLFAAGLLLAWGRAMMFLAFFVMMFLYYRLAKNEERRCLALFGAEYENYRRRVSFCIPGDRLLAGLAGRLPRIPLPPRFRAAAAFAATMLAALGLIQAVTAIRVRTRTVPFLVETVRLPGRDVPGAPGPALRTGRTAGTPWAASGRILVTRGPWRSAAAPGFAETVLRRGLRSPSLAPLLTIPERPSREAVIVFCVPFSPEGVEAGPGPAAARDPSRRGPAPDAAGPDRVRLLLFRCELGKGASPAAALAGPGKRRLQELYAAWIDLSRPEGEDLVVKGPSRLGPPGIPIPEGIAEERWAALMQTFAARRPQGPETAPERPAPAPAPETKLILVQAPVLRTRIQPEEWFGAEPHSAENHFAREILDRLARSPAFLDRLARTGAGGDIVPVAFPRPGSKWYREHAVRYHRMADGSWERTSGAPRISVFVMLVRGIPGADSASLFDESRRADRKILGAFTAGLDFGVDPPRDPVHEIVVVGPRRDIEERWDFFLSGL